MNCGTGTYDLCIEQGATFRASFIWTAGAPPERVNLAGYLALMQIRQFPLSPDLLFDASADLTLYADSGVIVLEISATDTENFTWAQGVYDLLLVSQNGTITRLIEGTVKIFPGITPP